MRFPTLGCPDLVFSSDNKHLVGLVKTVNLDWVGNPRLLCMSERMLRWRFGVTHIQGKKNRIPDALSTYPWAKLVVFAVLGAEYPTKEEIKEADELESAMVASVSGVILSCETICELLVKDNNIRKLMSLLQARDDREQWAPLLPWFALRGGLVVVFSPLLFKGRVVVLAAGRSATLVNLHGTHQGQTNMLARAQVWWQRHSCHLGCLCQVFAGGTIPQECSIWW